MADNVALQEPQANKNPKSGEGKYPSKLLLRIVQETPKIIQIVSVTLHCFSWIDGTLVFLKTPHA